MSSRPRRTPTPPPPLDEVPLHVLVRECPETLPLLREKGVDVAARGTEPAADLPDEVLGRVREVLRWRTEAP